MGRNLGFRYRLEHKHRFESVYIVKWIIIDINLRSRLEQPRTYIWKGCTGKWVTLDSNLDSGLEKEDHGFFYVCRCQNPVLHSSVMRYNRIRFITGFLTWVTRRVGFVLFNLFCTVLCRILSFCHSAFDHCLFIDLRLVIAFIL